ALMTRSLVRFEEEVALYVEIAKKLEDRGEKSIGDEARRLSVIRKNILFQIAKALGRFDFRGFRNYLGFLRNLPKNTR
ncbi:MAG: hypothetical protein EBX52_13780, partial [Proteobacteria bacterium]|nr:hypothetical protein [Pseudomonadota bacterium]